MRRDRRSDLIRRCAENLEAVALGVRTTTLLDPNPIRGFRL